MLDAPGCVPYRQVEQTPTGDRHVTKRALKIDDPSKVVEIYPDLKQRMENTEPVDVSELMQRCGTQRVIVGDKLTFEASGIDDAPLSDDVSAFTNERALAEFTVDKLGVRARCEERRVIDRCRLRRLACLHCWPHRSPVRALALQLAHARAAAESVRGRPAGRARAEGRWRGRRQGPQGASCIIMARVPTQPYARATLMWRALPGAPLSGLGD